MVSSSVASAKWAPPKSTRSSATPWFGEIALEPDYPSYIAFVPSVLHYVGNWVPEATRINFLAEKSDKTTSTLKRFHESLRDVLRATDYVHLLGNFDSGGKTSIPLQAADLFCWLHRRADAGRLDSTDARRLKRLTMRHGFPFDIEQVDLKELAEHLQGEMKRRRDAGEV